MEAVLHELLDSFTSLSWQTLSSPGPVKLPRIPQDILVYLLRRVSLIFQSEPPLLMLSGPTNVVGDIRGSLPDLLRILQERGLPGCENKYVFLGNLVDADSLSLEVLSLMLLLKALFPTDVFVIRGSHEVGSACSKLGFQKELSAAMHDLSIAGYLEYVQQYSVCRSCQWNHALPAQRDWTEFDEHQRIQKCAAPAR